MMKRFLLFSLSYFLNSYIIRQKQQIRDAILLMKKHPDARGNVIYDMYRIMCHGLEHNGSIDNLMYAEVILKSKVELGVAMLEAGLLSVIGDIILSEVDPAILVCFHLRDLSFILYHFF